MDFRRRDYKRASTSSQLTQSFKASPTKGVQEQPHGMQGLMTRLGLNAMDYEGLPSAFDSEDEDEIDMEDLRPAGSKGSNSKRWAVGDKTER